MSAERPPRSLLTAREAAIARPAIAAAIAARAAAWGVIGWAFVGRDPAIRVELRGSDKPGAPARPSDPILALPKSIGGRLLVTFAEERSPEPPALSTHHEPVTAPLAPGAPLLVGAGSHPRRVGLAAVLALDGEVHLLTCGHVFAERGGSEVYSSAAKEPVAILAKSYFEDLANPLDAAVCALTPRGLELLARSPAATWFERWIDPLPTASSSRAVFWPTHEAALGPIELEISSFSAASTVLFFDGPHDGFIEASFGAVPGDSGSVLALDDAFLGLCSGEVESSWSYFTSFASIVARLRRVDHREVALWRPDDGSSSLRS